MKDINASVGRFIRGFEVVIEKKHYIITYILCLIWIVKGGMQRPRLKIFNLDLTRV